MSKRGSSVSSSSISSSSSSDDNAESRKGSTAVGESNDPQSQPNSEEPAIELVAVDEIDASIRDKYIVDEQIAKKKNSFSTGGGTHTEPESDIVAEFVEEAFIEEELDDGKEKEEKKESEPMMRFDQLFRYGDTFDYSCMFVGTISAIGHGVLLSMFSILFGDVLDALSAPGTIVDTLRSKSYMFFYLAIVAFVTSFLQVITFSYSAARQSRRIKVLYFRSILNAENSYFDERQAGEISSRLGSDVMKIEAGIGDKIGSYLQFNSTAISGIIIGFVRGWQLTLVLLATAPLIVAGGAFMSITMAKMVSNQQTSYAKAGGMAFEILSLVRTVIAYGGEKYETKRYKRLIADARDQTISSGHLSGFSMGFVMGVVMFTYGIGLWAGGEFIKNQYMTASDVVTTFFATLMALFSLGQAAPSMEAFTAARGAAFAVFNTIDRKPEIEFLSDEGETPADFQGAISFKNVDFAYKSKTDRKIIDNFSIDIKLGQTIAFVGHSGCGKSTTISLIERFYDPTAGAILIDGIDVKDYNIQYLRSQIGYVSQMPTLFALSIAENIALGSAFAINPHYDPTKPISATRNPRIVRNGVTREEIENAAKLANAYNFINKLPEGFDTVIGERGSQLSGGQKQRIAIARALIRNPKILLLDEATSALDTHSEKIVQDAIDKAAKGRTTIVIAHRLSTVQNADKIAVVDGGKILELGTPSELYSLNGMYTRFVDLQAIRPNAADNATDGTTKAIQFVNGEPVLASSDDVAVGNPTDAAATQPGADADAEELDKELDKTLAANISVLHYLKRGLKDNADKWVYILLGIIGALLNGVVWPVFSLIFSKMLQVLFDYDQAKVMIYALSFFAIGAGFWFSTYLQTAALGISGEHLTFKLRMRCYKQIIHQQASWFDFKENSIGILVTRLGTEADMIKGLTGTLLGSYSMAFSTMFTALVISFTSCPLLALAVLGTIPFIAAGGVFQTKLMIGWTTGKVDAASGLAGEVIDNHVTVASLATGNEFISKYDGLLKEPMHAARVKSALQATAFGLTEFFMYAIWGISFLLGGELMRNESCDFEEVMTTISALMFSAMMMGQAMALVPDTSKAAVAAAKVYALLDAPMLLDTRHKTGQVLAAVTGNIEFRNIAFNYPTRPDTTILTNLSVSIQAGKTLALVGESGCGKSTLIGLSERFYNPASGSIYLDGHDVASLDVNFWRAQIGLVSQEPDLFSGTVRDNILYGNFDKNTVILQDQIDEAARLANAYDFIKTLPNGYDTSVGERGSKLSGGQKQRIVITRALLRNPKVLLLDEATSALDSQSEKIVQLALDRAAQGRTTIVIAHRLSTIQNADKIVFIKDGVVVEEGSHDQLMALNGHYTSLVKTQQKKH